MSIKQQVITATNSAYNLSQPECIHANLFGNLSIENPTVEQLNAAISPGETSRVQPNIEGRREG